MKNLDFVAIGDITTDAFIKLSGNDATVEKSSEGNKKTYVLILATKLSTTLLQRFHLWKRPERVCLRSSTWA